MEIDSKIVLTNEFDIQLIHTTHEIFTKVQNQEFNSNNKQFYQNQQQIKSNFRNVVSEYSVAIRNLIDSSLEDENDSEKGEDTSSERARLLTIEQLLSLFGVAFFQMDEKSNPGYYLASWMNYCYKQVIAGMVTELSGFGGKNENHLEVFLKLILTGRVEDARALIRIIRTREHKNNKVHIFALNQLDQVLMQYNVILSDSVSYPSRMDQFQQNQVVQSLAKISTEVGPDSEGLFAVEALKLMSGNAEPEKYAELCSSSESTDFIAPWFFDLLSHLLLTSPTSKTSQLSEIAEQLILSSYKDKNYPVLDILVLRILSRDASNLVDTFCESNDNWWLAAVLLDLLFQSNVEIPDAPHGLDFQEKRKLVMLEFAKTISTKPGNLKISLDFIIAAYDKSSDSEDCEIIDIIKTMLEAPEMSVNLTEKERIRVYHTILNTKILPQQIAEDYAAFIGKNEEKTAISVQWSIRSSDLNQLETKIVDSALTDIENFNQLKSACEQFQGVHFQRHTLNTKIVECVLNYVSSNNKSFLIDLLQSCSNELTGLVRLDILKELNALLYDTNTAATIDTEFLDKTSFSNLTCGSVAERETAVLTKIECLDLMRVLEKLKRKQNMAYNDLFDRFKKQLMGTYAHAVVNN